MIALIVASDRSVPIRARSVRVDEVADGIPRQASQWLPGEADPATHAYAFPRRIERTTKTA